MSVDGPSGRPIRMSPACHIMNDPYHKQKPIKKQHFLYVAQVFVAMTCYCTKTYTDTFVVPPRSQTTSVIPVRTDAGHDVSCLYINLTPE